MCEEVHSLDVIIAIGYRVQSDVAVRFHRWATQRLHEHTAAELIYERVDSEKPFVGMTNFKGDYVIKDDVKIAKNYLSELELKRLNLLVSEFLDFAEFQALEEKPMKMQDWITALDNQNVAHQRKILKGTVQNNFTRTGYAESRKRIRFIPSERACKSKK